MGKVRQDKEDYRRQFKRVSIVMNDALVFITDSGLYDKFIKYLGEKDEERNES